MDQWEQAAQEYKKSGATRNVETGGDTSNDWKLWQADGPAEPHTESPMEYAKNTIRNVPSSLANTAKQMAFGPQSMAIEGTMDAWKHRNDPVPSFRDAVSQSVDKAKEVGSSLVKPFLHPIDSFEQDPVGTGAAWFGAKKLIPSEVGEFAKGSTRAAARQVRPVLDKASIWHPLKNVGLAYDAGKNTVMGGVDAVRPPVNSPFNQIRAVTPPSSGGTPFNPKPTGIEGGGEDLLGPSNIGHESDIPGGQSGSIKKQALKTVKSNQDNTVPGNNKKVGSTLPDDPQITEPDSPQRGGVMKQMMKRASGLGKDTRGSVNLGRFGGSGSGEPAEMPVAATETRQVQAPERASTQGPSNPAAPQNASRPVTRNVIYDENNKPVAYDDPTNPYNGPGKIREVKSPSNAYTDQDEGMLPGTEAPDRNLPSEERRAPKPLPSAADLHEQRTEQYRPKDVHDDIAMEGIQKRAADSRAKYEDVYNNVIKGQYTPEQLRNMTPELQTELDMKIKGIKHPETGKKKYGSGLNPAVTESLAQRLQAETQ